MRAILILFSFLVYTPPGSAQVATAPLFLEQRLINPAAAVNRRFLGFATDASRQVEKENVLELEDSSIGIDTTIDTFNLNSAGRAGNYSFELNMSPQQGTKTTNSATGSGTSSVTVTKLNLVPIQAIVATSFNSNFQIGFKVLYAYFHLDDSTNLAVFKDTLEFIDDTKSFQGSFTMLSPGLIYQLGKTGLSFGYVAEFFQFDNKQVILGTNTLQDGFNKTIKKIDINSKDTLLVRKDVVGIGYKVGSATGSNFRVDMSYEKMPPLAKNAEYPYGEMYRLAGELSFTVLSVGAEFTRKTGYYVDPYKLIPYFFKVDHLGIQAIQDVGFFGGLRTQRGHSYGASISFSKANVEEQLSASSSLQNVEKNTQRIGLSYAYVF